MKKYIFLLIFIYSIDLYSQEKDSIIYILPDKVETKISDQLELIDGIEQFNLEFYLELINQDRFRLTFSFSRNQSDNYWIVNTNRFLLINKRKYALFFDYDSIFSTSKPKEIGAYGHREGTISKSSFIYEGYNITFDRLGLFVLENWGITTPKCK